LLRIPEHLPRERIEYHPPKEDLICSCFDQAKKAIREEIWNPIQQNRKICQFKLDFFAGANEYKKQLGRVEKTDTIKKYQGDFYLQ
jgi:hypothetical protein